MIRCHVPLIALTDCDGRLAVTLSNCQSCTADTTHLLLTKDGCKEFVEEVVLKDCTNHSFGCGCIKCPPQVTVRYVEAPMPSVIYPLHEIDCEGRAVFVLDGKLKSMGYGRYKAEILQAGCAILRFDIDYQCGAGAITAIDTMRSTSMGERC